MTNGQALPARGNWSLVIFHWSFLPALCLSLTAAAPGADSPMSWLENGAIRLGADLSLGGAITWLSRAGDGTNVVNSFDWGRQIQMSYYAGPIPFTAGDKRPRPFWAGLGWNPIQVGDDFGHRSRLLEHRNDGHSLYVKCVPMQWPLDDVSGDCTFESWIELEGAAVHVRARLNNARADRTRYDARPQELPAVYTNGPWHRIISYTGDQPFTGAAVREMKGMPPPQWDRWSATENWSALVDDRGWGLGVWNPGCTAFAGGFNGQPGRGGPRDTACGYLAPQRVELLDADITHEYRYDLVLGTVEEIRAHVYRQPRPAAAWTFAQDRAGWHYLNADDTGWPIRGELNVPLTRPDPALVSPPFAVRAEAAPVLVIEARFEKAQPHPQVFWTTFDAAGMSEERSVRFPAENTTDFREYRVRLADSPRYRGLITSLRFDPADGPGGAVHVRAVRLVSE